MVYIEASLEMVQPFSPHLKCRLASHSLFSDWMGAGEKGLVTLGYILCLYQNLGRDYSLIFPRDPKIA